MIYASKCSKYSKKCNIYLFMRKYHMLYSRYVVQTSWNHICDKIHMLHPHQTLIFHFMLWNLSHWKYHILILILRICWPPQYTVPFHNLKTYTGTNTEVAACLIPSTYDLFAALLPFVGVIKLFIFLTGHIKISGNWFCSISFQ